MSHNLPADLLRLKLQGTDLTTRERQVLRWLAVGDQQPKVAERLGISLESVRKYSKTARARLGAKTNTQAVATALSLDLI